MTTAHDPVKLFYVYSHVDEAYREKLQKHLATLWHQGLIAHWHDRNIGAGTEWKSQIDEHLNSARLILLLVSDDFLASDYCYNIEMGRAMERHAAGEARVIPVILRACDWKWPPIGNLQALPKDGIPVTSWSDLDEAFLNVAEGVRQAVEELTSCVELASAAENSVQSQQAAIISREIPIPPYGVAYVRLAVGNRWITAQFLADIVQIHHGHFGLDLLIDDEQVLTLAIDGTGVHQDLVEEGLLPLPPSPHLLTLKARVTTADSVWISPPVRFAV